MDNVFKIGTSEAGLTDIEALSTPLLPPEWTFSDSARQIQLASGHVRGMGFPVITWHWGFLEAAQRTQLRVYCPGVSAPLFIQSPDNTGTDKIYQVVMIWPAGESIQSGMCIDFAPEFRHCVEVT